MELEDPLKNWELLKVTDIASARYALKIANDQHFAVIHMREHMERELARSVKEVRKQTVILLMPYVDMYDSQGRPTPYLSGDLTGLLLDGIPQKVLDGINYMQEQLTVERARAEAELADQCEPLNEIKAQLLELVKPWFAAEVQARPDWLGENNSATLGGCTMTYTGDDVIFEFAELDYGD